MAYLDAVTRLGPGGGPRMQYAGFAPAAATAAITGTLSGALESDIVAGGRRIIITLTNDTFVAFNDTIRQAVIDGLDSAQSETLGWNNEVRDKEVVGSVVRDSNTQVTITLTASPLYDITANEVITVTVPASALTGGSPLTATPTVTVSFVAEDEEAPSGGYGAYNYYQAYRQRRRWRKKKRERYEAYLESLEPVEREISELLQDSEEEIKLRELERLVEQLESEQEALREYNQRVSKAYDRALEQRNYSALMAFEREMERAIEEEEFLLLAIALLQ